MPRRNANVTASKRRPSSCVTEWEPDLVHIVYLPSGVTIESTDRQFLDALADLERSTQRQPRRR